MAGFDRWQGTGEGQSEVRSAPDMDATSTSRDDIDSQGSAAVDIDAGREQRNFPCRHNHLKIAGIVVGELDGIIIPKLLTAFALICVAPGIGFHEQSVLADHSLLAL